MPWEIRDYCDGRQRNLIERWLDGLPAMDRAAINASLKHLSRFERLELPLFRWFKGRWRGIGEVRIRVKTVRYRILGCEGPGPMVLTLLLGTSKKTSDVSAREKDSAVERKDLLRSDASRSQEHDLER